MNVLIVSQCSKSALVETRRILDQFAERKGERTWQTAITAQGLITVRKLLRKTAKRNTAVACHWIKGANQTELLWIVGNLRKFNEQGTVPTNATTRDVLRSQDENQWHTAEVISLLAGVAGLFHDFGKANKLFQQKLKPKAKLQSEPYRHEWVSEKVVRRLMAEEQLVVRTPRRRRFSAYAGDPTPAVPNLLNRDFYATAPNAKWLTDLTEIHIPAGKVYVSPILDCFDGLVVAWNIGTSPDANLVNTMLGHAVQTLRPGEYPVIHSDRGSHYRWPEWIRRINNARLTRSMSRKGCSPDNAACEGFFGRLKNELIYPRSWQDVTLEAFMKRIDAYIRWYNEHRIKISLGGRSPIEYRRALGLLSV